MERFEIKEKKDEYFIYDHKTNMTCLILPKQAYKDPKSAIEGFKGLMELTGEYKNFEWKGE